MIQNKLPQILQDQAMRNQNNDDIEQIFNEMQYEKQNSTTKQHTINQISLKPKSYEIALRQQIQEIADSSQLSELLKRKIDYQQKFDILQENNINAVEQYIDISAKILQHLEPMDSMAVTALKHIIDYLVSNARINPAVVDQMNKENKLLKQQLSDLQEENDGNKELLEKNLQQYLQLQEYAKQKTEELDDLKEKHKKLLLQTQELSNKCTIQDQQLNDLSAKLLIKNEEINKLASENNKLFGQNVAYKNQLEEKLLAELQLEEKLKRVQQTASKQLAEAQRLFEEATESLKQSQLSKQSNKQKQTELLELIESLRKEVNILSAVQTEREQIITGLKKKIEDQQFKYDNHNNIIKQLQNEFQSQIQEIKKQNSAQTQNLVQQAIDRQNKLRNIESMKNSQNTNTANVIQNKNEKLDDQQQIEDGEEYESEEINLNEPNANGRNNPLNKKYANGKQQWKSNKRGLKSNNQNRTKSSNRYQNENGDEVHVRDRPNSVMIISSIDASNDQQESKKKKLRSHQSSKNNLYIVNENQIVIGDDQANIQYKVETSDKKIQVDISVIQKLISDSSTNLFNRSKNSQIMYCVCKHCQREVDIDDVIEDSDENQTGEQKKNRMQSNTQAVDGYKLQDATQLMHKKLNSYINLLCMNGGKISKEEQERINQIQTQMNDLNTKIFKLENNKQRIKNNLQLTNKSQKFKLPNQLYAKQKDTHIAAKVQADDQQLVQQDDIKSKNINQYIGFQSNQKSQKEKRIAQPLSMQQDLNQEQLQINITSQKGVELEKDLQATNIDKDQQSVEDNITKTDTINAQLQVQYKILQQQGGYSIDNIKTREQQLKSIIDQQQQHQIINKNTKIINNVVSVKQPNQVQKQNSGSDYNQDEENVTTNSLDYIADRMNVAQKIRQLKDQKFIDKLFSQNTQNLTVLTKTQQNKEIMLNMYIQKQLQQTDDQQQTQTAQVPEKVQIEIQNVINQKIQLLTQKDITIKKFDKIKQKIKAEQQQQVYITQKGFFISPYADAIKYRNMKKQYKESLNILDIDQLNQILVNIEDLQQIQVKDEIVPANLYQSVVKQNVSELSQYAINMQYDNFKPKQIVLQVEKYDNKYNNNNYSLQTFNGFMSTAFAAQKPQEVVQYYTQYKQQHPLMLQDNFDQGNIDFNALQQQFSNNLKQQQPIYKKNTKIMYILQSVFTRCDSSSNLAKDLIVLKKQQFQDQQYLKIEIPQQEIFQLTQQQQTIQRNNENNDQYLQIRDQMFAETTAKDILDQLIQVILSKYDQKVNTMQVFYDSLKIKFGNLSLSYFILQLINIMNYSSCNFYIECTKIILLQELQNTNQLFNLLFQINSFKDNYLPKEAIKIFNKLAPLNDLQIKDIRVNLQLYNMKVTRKLAKEYIIIKSFNFCNDLLTQRNNFLYFILKNKLVQDYDFTRSVLGVQMQTIICNENYRQIISKILQLIYPITKKQKDVVEKLCDQVLNIPEKSDVEADISVHFNVMVEIYYNLLEVQNKIVILKQADQRLIVLDYQNQICEVYNQELQNIEQISQYSDVQANLETKQQLDQILAKLGAARDITKQLIANKLHQMCYYWLYIYQILLSIANLIIFQVTNQTK